MNQNAVLRIIKLLGVAVVVLINSITFFVFVMVLNRFFATDSRDLSTTVSIFLALIVLLPLWKQGQKLLGFKNKALSLELKTQRHALIIANLFFVGLVIILHASLDRVSDCSYQDGVKAYQQKKYSDAIRYYKKAIHQNPENKNAHLALANVYEDIAQTELAKKHYWLSIYSQDVPFKAYNNLARLYIKEGQSVIKERRESAFDSALDLLFLALKDIENTRESSSKEVTEQRGIIHKNVAWAYLRLGEYPLATSNILRALTEFNASGTLKTHREAFCLYAIISSNNVGSNDVLDGRRYAKQCHSGSPINEHGGIERELEREVRKLYGKSEP